MERIVVGMSGGVDSSGTALSGLTLAAALLLKRQGYDVVGVFMKNWDEKDENGTCTAADDWNDVQSVCDTIGIPCYAVNFEKEYYDRVFSYFLDEYRRGRTPNPDVLCNREIKFRAFLDYALKLGASRMATGHFVQSEVRGGRPVLLKGADAAKDQSYFLYMLKERQLARALFPVGGMTKAQVRAVAEENGLSTSKKKDSTGVCFIGERNFRRFLQGFLPMQPGQMRTPDGRVVGEHIGLAYYTLGQRRGLGIGGGGDGRRWFVVGKDLASNRLIVQQGEDSPLLYSSACEINELHWLSDRAPAADGAEFSCQVRLRHRQPLQDARAVVSGDMTRITFDAPQRAVTPGQAAVLYQGDICLGGGTVERAFRH